MVRKHYSKLSLFIRSLLFSIYSLTTITLYSFVCVLSFPFPLKTRFYLIHLYLHAYMFVLKHLCHIDYKVEGLENIPKDRTGIVMSKHQSTLETFILPLIFGDPAIILKRELFWIPFFGWGLAVAQPIAINRNQKKSAMQQVIDKGKKCLEEGRWIIIYPEGTRIPYGKVGHYRPGGARLAHATGAPILPVAHNAGRFWPKRKFIKQPGTVRIILGPLIEPKNRTPEELLELTKTWIEETVKTLD